MAGNLAAAETLPAPKIWLNHFELGTLATANDDDWPVTRQGLDTAFFAINTLWPLAKPMSLSIPPDTAAAAAAKLHDSGIKIGVECGYFDHSLVLKEPGNPATDVLPSHALPQLVPGVGEHTARVEIAKLRSLWQAGHPPDYLVLDDPMRRLTIPGQDSPAQVIQGMADYPGAAREICSYMRVMREKFPAVRFVVILNFPNWGWKGEPAYLLGPGRPNAMNWGDAHVAMETLFSVMRAEKQSISAIQADFPWRYYAERPTDAVAASVDWPGRLLQLEAYARSNGVRFHLTANSETGYVSAQAFAEDSLRYLDAYLAAGGKPDHFVVQSWYPHPKALLPESTPYTGSWLAARFIERLREIKNGAPTAAEAPKPRPFDRSEPEALLHLIKRVDPQMWKNLAPPIRESWLDNEEEPPTSLAGNSLLGLRRAAAESILGKPRITVLIQNGKAKAGMGLPPVVLTPGSSQCWIVEVVSAETESKLETVWTEQSQSEPMAPVWIAPGSSRILVVGFDTAAAKNGSVVLCLGKPGGEVRKVAIPVSNGD